MHQGAPAGDLPVREPGKLCQPTLRRLGAYIPLVCLAADIFCDHAEVEDAPAQQTQAGPSGLLSSLQG